MLAARIAQRSKQTKRRLDPDTKALVEGTSGALGIPVYQLLTTAFLKFYEDLGQADRDLIEKVAEKRK